MRVTVRWMNSGDADAYGRMAHQLWDQMSVMEHMQDNARGFTENEKRRSAIAHCDGEEAGFADLGFRVYVNGAQGSPIGHLEGIWVDERFRHRGVGRALVEFCEAEIRRRGLSEMTSEAVTENTGSIEAHKSWGFDEHSRIVQFRKAL